MLYLTVGSRRMNETGWSPLWGHIITPASGNSSVEPGRYWAIDNGVFTGSFDPTTYLAFLDKNEPDEFCLFAVAPDVVGDAEATLGLFPSWRAKMSRWPVAFVAQDGQEALSLPNCDALFIGGSTEWKMGAGVIECIRKAKQRGAWVHVGRVNSGRRIRHFALCGVDSVDGSALAFGPDRNRRWIEKALLQEPLFELL